MHLHEALKIALVRAIVHDQVLYVSDDVDGAREYLDSTLVDDHLKARVKIVAQYSHSHTINPKSVIQEGRAPTKRDAVRWKRIHG